MEEGRQEHASARPGLGEGKALVAGICGPSREVPRSQLAASLQSVKVINKNAKTRCILNHLTGGLEIAGAEPVGYASGCNGAANGAVSRVGHDMPLKFQFVF